jgi:hypothetical protein
MFQQQGQQVAVQIEGNINRGSMIAWSEGEVDWTAQVDEYVEISPRDRIKSIDGVLLIL